ncbi:MAG: hypothetical protein SP4CHLAM5_07900 [Chlamydiia bacterium]|nr:hypothetical protein [Chlamydiia bacterium]MCH9618654.1 hypothetical protein [Chlamydiia bacterium]MCH9623845.1 hypothetical protein [Chlamydiia bacterium]
MLKLKASFFNLLVMCIPSCVLAIGAVSGLVTSESGEKIEGANVCLYKNQLLLENVVTDDQGKYIFCPLLDGTYRVQACAENMQTFVQGVTVTCNKVSTANFSLLKNPATLTGVVTDKSALEQTPIVGAKIKVTNKDIIIGSGITDNSGAYSIHGLPATFCNVQADAKDFQTEVFGVQLAENKAAAVDFMLPSSPSELKGVVETSCGLPIPLTMIEVQQNNITLATTLTSLCGHYQFTNLAPGYYDIQAIFPYHDTVFLGAEVVEGKETITNFTLQKGGGKISGTVIDQGTKAPIAGAIVEIKNDNMVIATAVTDSNGKYSVPGLMAEAYNVLASAMHYDPIIIGGDVGKDAKITVDFSLQPSSFSEKKSPFSY